jgi:NagD protein
VLTNNPFYTPRDLSARLRISGLEVPEDRIWTSALATAEFLRSQHPGGTAFVIGEAGLTTALHEAGYVQTETQPDYVVIGETRNYSFDRITQAIRFINNGARFIITNPDATGPTPPVSCRRPARSPRSSRMRRARPRTWSASRTR